MRALHVFSLTALGALDTARRDVPGDRPPYDSRNSSTGTEVLISSESDRVQIRYQTGGVSGP